MRVTIKDVAKSAGVSTATVSYVLNNPQKVSAQTRDKVLQAIDELGYTPNALARGLVGKKTRSMAVVVSPGFSSQSETGLAQILQGIGQSSYEADYSFMLLFQEHLSPQLVAELTAKGVEGLILIGLDARDSSTTRLPFPAIAVTFAELHPKEPAPYQRVHFSHLQALELAVTHLTELGRENIAFITPPGYGTNPLVSETLLRLRVETQARISLWPAEVSAPGGYIAVDKFLTGSEVDSIITYTDSMAIGVLHALCRKDLRVPEDLALIGTNDDPGASYSEPPLTTIRVPWFALGQAAVDLLLGDEIGSDISPKLIIRESCGSHLWI